ncbi:MAG: SufE family protein [Parachlamydiaceae bacterium]
MFESCLRKQNEIKALFVSCKTEEERYKKIIELGRQVHPLDHQFKVPENIVPGCQSTMYLRAYLDEGNVVFEVDSDALISLGLAVLLLKVYSGEPSEVILKCPPTYLEELGISASLTPSRSNGLYSIHLRMKQEALKLLLEREKG